jgi:hypothetical protein
VSREPMDLIWCLNIDKLSEVIIGRIINYIIRSSILVIELRLATGIFYLI